MFIAHWKLRHHLMLFFILLVNYILLHVTIVCVCVRCISLTFAWFRLNWFVLTFVHSLHKSATLVCSVVAVLAPIYSFDRLWKIVSRFSLIEPNAVNPHSLPMPMFTANAWKTPIHFASRIVLLWHMICVTMILILIDRYCNMFNMDNSFCLESEKKLAKLLTSSWIGWDSSHLATPSKSNPFG